MLGLKGTTFKFRMRHAIHYVSSSIIARNKRFLQESPRKWDVILAVPFGAVLTVYIKNKAKNRRKGVLRNDDYLLVDDRINWFFGNYAGQNGES